jgi:glycosyltransferase involved in cell wall biosynthesis
MSKKTKIAYISPDCFFDVDFPILSQLNRIYDLTWVPIIGDQTRYSKEDIIHFSDNNNLKYNLNIRKGRRRSLKQIYFSFKLIRQIKKIKPDIIYTEYLGDIYILLFTILMLPRSKVIYALHDAIEHTAFVSKAEQIVYWLAKKYCMNFHLFSRTQKDILESLYPNKKCFYAPLALKHFGKGTIVPPQKEDVCKLIFFGSIVEYKGLDMLIEAIEELAEEGSDNVLLTIAGRGKYWETCKALIKTEKLYNLKIEYIDDSEIPNLFRSNHFLVLPYKDVTQSGPLMIAFNYNIPTIASDHPGFVEYILDGKTGFVYKNGSIDSLKQVLRNCIKMNCDNYKKMKYQLEIQSKKEFEINLIIEKYTEMFSTF